MPTPYSHPCPFASYKTFHIPSLIHSGVTAAFNLSVPLCIKIPLDKCDFFSFCVVITGPNIPRPFVVFFLPTTKKTHLHHRGDGDYLSHCIRGFDSDNSTLAEREELSRAQRESAFLCLHELFGNIYNLMPRCDSD